MNVRPVKPDQTSGSVPVNMPVVSPKYVKAVSEPREAGNVPARRESEILKLVKLVRRPRLSGSRYVKEAPATKEPEEADSITMFPEVSHMM